MPPAGIEPALPKERDFESRASTNSTRGAYVVLLKRNGNWQLICLNYRLVVSGKYSYGLASVNINSVFFYDWLYSCPIKLQTALN